jgi:hypothetical protein
VDLVILASNSDQRLHWNVPKDVFFQYDMMVYVISRSTHTLLNKILAVDSAMILFLQLVKMSILENQSTTMNI